MPKKISVKKTLGAIGFFLIFVIAGIAAWKAPEQIAAILWPLIILVGTLFGIKSFSGVMLQKIQNNTTDQG